MSSPKEGNERQTVGVVAIQGDFAKHLEMLESMGEKAREVRLPEDLSDIDRLIIPGGESTTVGLLMQEIGLGEAILEAASNDVPIWGTCMGMIMMAREVVGRPHQYTLGLLDIVVERNAFGAQIHSFEDEIHLEGQTEPVMGVFIRAPIVTETGADVQIIARYRERVVAVRQGRRIGTSFHPELTDDSRMHQYFLKI